MAPERKIISVFGSHIPEPKSPVYEQGVLLGNLLARAGFAVATGGYSGVMAAVSQGASEGGGYVLGVSSARIEQMRNAQLNRWVNDEVRYESLEERILHLVKCNDGMIVLPGGVGTLSEFALAWNFIQVHEVPPRPLVLLGGMWPDLIAAFARPEYVPAEHLAMLKIVETPELAVATLVEFASNSG